MPHPQDTKLSTPGPRSRWTRPHQPRGWLPYSGFTPFWPHHHHQYFCARNTWGSVSLTAVGPQLTAAHPPGGLCRPSAPPFVEEPDSSQSAPTIWSELTMPPMVLSASHHPSQRLGEGLSRLAATLPHNPPQSSGCPSATKYSADELPRTDAGAPRPVTANRTKAFGARDNTLCITHCIRHEKDQKGWGAANWQQFLIAIYFRTLLATSPPLHLTSRPLRCRWPLSGIETLTQRWPR